MLKAIARIQTAVAIAQGNGDTAALSAFQSAIAAITPFAVDPYILPDVLTPADVPAAPVPTSIQEAHDMVQAGVITREDAVDSGVIQSVDQLPPHPDELNPAADSQTSPAEIPAPTPVAVDPSSAPVDGAPANSVPEQVTPPSEATPTGEPANASVPQAGSDVAPEQVIQTVLPDAAVQPDIAPVVGQPTVAQADPGDEDPTPADKETIASEDKRIDAIEDKLGMRTGKVSRQ